MKINEFADKLKDMRIKYGVSQQQLSEALGVSVQAVSKWECAKSYPDISILPLIAKYYRISLDELFDRDFHIAQSMVARGELAELPDDNILRVVLVRNGQILREEAYRPDNRIFISVPGEKTQRIEVWGNADIDGDVAGNVVAGACVECGNVYSEVSAGGNVTANSIHGNVAVGTSVDCNMIFGEVTCGTFLTCEQITGNVTTGTDIECGDISGNVNARSVNCGDIEGDVFADELSCGDISGQTRPRNPKNDSTGDVRE